MTRRKGYDFVALLLGLLLLAPALVSATFLSDLPDWTVIRMTGGGGSFGWDVSGAGDVNGDGFEDVIVTGAYFQSEEAEINEGAAWVYAGSADGLGAEAVWMYESNDLGANFGMDADSAGDVNGDGYGDIVIGAPRYKDPDWPNRRGAAFVFHGSPDGLTDEPDSFFSTTVDQPAAFFGRSVAGVRDIDGDGYDDVAVGVQRYDSGDGERRGAIFVYYGSPDGLVDVADIVPADPEIGGYYFDLAAAGDVNGDGFADLIAGGIGYVDSVEQRAAYVYHGATNGLDHAPSWYVVSADQPTPSNFADNVAGAGDVNGDGFDDVLVGAQGYERPGLPEGAAFLYLGSPSGPSPDADWAGYASGYASDNPVDSVYGTGVAGAGDVDGDGFDDIVIGCSDYQSDPDATWRGAVFVYRGSPTGPAETPDWIGYAPDGSWAHLGFPEGPVAGAGDVNGDGHADILIGDYTYRIDDDNSGGGAAAYYGGPVDGDDDDTDDDADDDGDDDTDDDGGGDDGGVDDDDAGADDDSVPDTNGSRGDSLVQDDDGPCGC